MKKEQHERADELRRTISEKSERLDLIREIVKDNEEQRSVVMRSGRLNAVTLPRHIAKTALILLQDHGVTELAALKKEYEAL